MKFFLLLIIVTLLSCREPLLAPGSPETLWIDSETHSDTLITNVSNQWSILYYAAKDWQTSADTSLSHGYRLIGIRFGDSVLVHSLNDTSSNYTGPYVVAANKRNDTLIAQNFLDSNNTNPARIYVLFNR